MEITIKKVWKSRGTLNVRVDTPYGEERLGLSEDADKLDPKTGEPVWKHETRRLLEKKYGEKLPDGTASAQQEEEIGDEYVGEKMEIQDLPKKGD